MDGDGKFERVSGTSVGGGTFWGLGRLLTKCKRLLFSPSHWSQIYVASYSEKKDFIFCCSFDELLELSHQGNNRVIDMLVGDIYGGLDYSKVGFRNSSLPVLLYINGDIILKYSFADNRLGLPQQPLLRALVKPFQKTESLRSTSPKISPAPC